MSEAAGRECEGRQTRGGGRPIARAGRVLRQAALSALLVGTGVLAAAAVGEIGARLFLPAPTRVVYKAVSKPAAGAPDVFMIPTERGFRHSPNSEVAITPPSVPWGPDHLQTNSLGYRNREVGPKQGERILFLGDSITLGLNFSGTERWTRRPAMATFPRATSRTPWRSSSRRALTQGMTPARPGPFQDNG